MSTTATPAPTSILKKSKTSTSSSSLNPPTKTPTSLQTAEAHLLESQLPLPPKKERKPKRPNPDSTTEASKPSSKRAKKDAVVPAEEEEVPVVEGKKAEKKRLRAEAQAARPPLPPVVAEAAKPLVWDEEKNGRNPYEDERLSEAAKKAIAYSQTIQNPFLKFQKARQNFLLRHIYNENEIPNEYLPIVLAYLKTVKGGSRDSLIASASLILNPPPKPEPTTTDAPAASAEESTTEPAAAEEAEVAEEEEETEEEKEVKRSRAKALLEILGESVGGEKKEKKKSKKSKKVEEAVMPEGEGADEE